jgi:hypothetical protein
LKKSNIDFAGCCEKSTFGPFQVSRRDPVKVFFADITH